MYEIDCRVYFSTNSTYKHIDFMDEVQEHFKTEGIYKNAIISANYTFLDTPKLDWDDIILTTAQKDMIDRHAINFLERLDDYKELGMRTSRGVLLLGPPGTGKNIMLCRSSKSIMGNIVPLFISRILWWLFQDLMVIFTGLYTTLTIFPTILLGVINIMAYIFV